MTQAERASLERLEDMIGRRLDGIEGKVDGVDARLRKVEIDVATMHGADGQAARAGASRVQWIGLTLSVAVILIALPASVLAIINVVGAVGG